MNTASNGPGGPSRDSGPQSRAGSNGDQIKEGVREVADQAREEGRARAEHARESAADNLDKLAGGARAAASELEDDDAGQLSHYVADAAERISELSGNLREKTIDELMRDVTRFAREQPAMFLGGSLAIGFGLARFARASAPRQRLRHAASDNRSTVADTSSEAPRASSDPTGRHWPAGSASSRSTGVPAPSTQPAGFSGAASPGNDPTSNKHGAPL